MQMWTAILHHCQGQVVYVSGSVIVESHLAALQILDIHGPGYRVTQ